MTAYKSLVYMIKTYNAWQADKKVLLKWQFSLEKDMDHALKLAPSGLHRSN